MTRIRTKRVRRFRDSTRPYVLGPRPFSPCPHGVETNRVAWLKRIVESGAISERGGYLVRDVWDPETRERVSAREDRAKARAGW